MTTPPDWAIAVPNLDSIHGPLQRRGGELELPFTWEQMQQYFLRIMEAFIEKVALGLGWVDIGDNPFDFLVDFGTEALAGIDQALRDAVSGLISGSTLTDVIDRLQHITTGTGQFDAEQLFNILNIPQLNNISVPGLAEIKDAVFQAITSLSNIGITIPQLITALQNIPGINISGSGGPATVPQTFLETWFQLVAGVVGAVGGTVGTVGLPDLFNVGYDLSSRATRGMFAFDIAAIRNNSGLNTGFFPTTQSNISMDKLAIGVSALPTFAITQSTAITAYHRIAQASDFALVSWQGYGVTNVTDCFVNIYKMDTTTGINSLVHASANIVGLLTGGTVAVPVAYDLPTAVHVEPGEVFGIEIAIRGAGTHNIAGEISGLQDQLVFPRRYSSFRNSGTSAPPSSFTPTYGTNVPIVEFGVTSGLVGMPHSPEIKFYGTIGTDTIPFPLWANIAQVQAVGSGGGGRQGGTFSLVGEGGNGGAWATGTWVRGVDFAAGTTPAITRTVTAGGAGGSSGLGLGSNGGSTTVSIPGHTVVATGGTGGTVLTGGGSSHWQGESPSPQTITVDTQPYTAGGPQTASGSPGVIYGGGGSGGNDVFAQVGGSGARGGIWIRFKQ